MTKRIYLNSLLLGSIIILTGCNLQQPNWMPRGYANNDETPISSPTKTTPWSDDSVVNDVNKISEDGTAWNGAVFELLNKSQSFLAPQNEPIFVMAEKSNNHKNNNSFDHYLRQGLMKKGYTITTTAGANPILMFKILPLEKNGEYDLTLTKKSPDGKTVIGTSSITAIIP